MATVQKSSKINFYKFVQVKAPSGSMSANKDQVALTSAINSNVKATNNLGSTLNSIANVLTDFKKIQLAQLDIDQKNRVKFQAEYTKTKKSSSPIMGAVGGAAKKAGSWLDGLLKMVGSFLKAAIIIPALEWLADEENQKKVETAINIIGDIAKFIFDVSKFAVTNTIEGLYDLLKDDATWQERLLGLGKAVVGIGTIVLGVRYLKNPTKIITDIGRGIRALINFVTGGGRRGRNPNLPSTRNSRARGFGRFLLGTGATIGTGYLLNQAMNQPEPENKAQGGPIKKASQGGWISGPQSGYKVSLDGGRSTSFIGHGTEYVARKSNGGAFVVPFNTPGTKTQPHLTQKRIGEAKRLGYNLPGFAAGGQYLKDVKNNDATQGSNANKKIFLHWSAGGRYGTNFYNGHGYHTYIDGSGRAVRRAKFGQRGVPHHTYGRDKASSAAIGVAGMSTASEENYRSWGSEAITPGQWKGMAKEAAAIATNWGWKPSDITDKRVRTHSEEYRDYPNWYHRNNSSHYRWDLNRLYAGDQKNTGGNKIRGMIKQEMAGFGNGSSASDAARDGHKARPWNQWLGIADALTGNVFNLDGVPRTSSSGGGANRDGSGGDEQQSSHNAHGFGALLDMIGKHESDSSGGYDAVNQIGTHGGHGVEGYAGPFSKMKQHGGKKLTSMTVGEVMDLQAPRSGMSDAEWIRQGRLHATGRYQIIGPTLKTLVDRGVASRSDKYNEATQNKLGVALIKGRGRNAAGLKSEWIGLKNETAGAILAAWDANGAKTKGGHSAASGGSTGSGGGGGYGGGGDGGGGGSTSAPARLLKRFGFSPSSSKALDAGTYTTQPGAVDGGERNRLQRQTDSRNAARRQINERTQQMVQTAMTAIAQQNGVNSQAIAAAQQSIQMVMSQPQPQPALAGGGGAAPKPSTASSLNSFINPLKNIFK